MTKVVVLFLFLSSGLLGCSNNGFQASVPVIDQSSQNSSEGSEGEEPPRPAPSTTTTTLPYVYEPLLWEPVRAGSKAWSTFVFDLIRGEASALLNATDFNFFCPNYAELSLDQKINAAGMLISGMTRYESNHNPLARYHESTMGIDPITGQPVYSEGLLQLSYQDIQGYPFCQLDWETDQHLSPTDPNKTILNPITNLDCGVRILARQVSRRGTIILSTGAYWSVIKSNSQYNKLNEISALVQTLDFCQSP